jgi:hypothetical protein
MAPATFQGSSASPAGNSGFSAPSVFNTPSPQLGANGNPTRLTRQQYQAVVNAKGQAATDDWMRRNNITVGN